MIGDAAGGLSEAEALEDSPGGRPRDGAGWSGGGVPRLWGPGEGGGGRASETALDEGVAE